MAPNLETIPAEIKHNIFNNLTSIADLSSLVHASASYYRTYHSDNTRENVLTDLVLYELGARDVNLFHPVPFLEICLRDRARLDAKTEEAIVAVRAQRKSQIHARRQGKKVVPRIRLSAAQCVALRNVEDVLPWQLKGDSLSSACGDEYVLRALSYGRQNYYAMTDSPVTLARLKMWSRRKVISTFRFAADREFMNLPLRGLQNHFMYRVQTEIFYCVCNMLGGRNERDTDYWKSGR